MGTIDGCWSCAVACASSEYGDRVLKAHARAAPRDSLLAGLPIATPASGIQVIGELASLNRTVGPTVLRRVNKASLTVNLRNVR